MYSRRVFSAIGGPERQTPGTVNGRRDPDVTGGLAMSQEHVDAVRGVWTAGTATTSTSCVSIAHPKIEWTSELRPADPRA